MCSEAPKSPTTSSFAVCHLITGEEKGGGRLAIAGEEGKALGRKHDCFTRQTHSPQLCLVKMNTFKVSPQRKPFFFFLLGKFVWVDFEVLFSSQGISAGWLKTSKHFEAPAEITGQQTYRGCWERPGRP